MKITFDLKDYVVAQILLPDLGKWQVAGSFDTFDEALQVANRDRGQIVVHIPEAWRLSDGSVFVFDMDVAVKRVEEERRKQQIVRPVTVGN